jgi:hypothetical protein
MFFPIVWLQKGVARSSAIDFHHGHVFFYFMEKSEAGNGMEGKI